MRLKKESVEPRVNANKRKSFKILSDAEVREMDERERVGYEKFPQTEEELAIIDELLKSTSGIWDGGDGLEYQCKLRAEWKNRSPSLATKKPERVRRSKRVR